MKRVSVLVLMILMVQGISAQDKERVEEKKFGIEFSGFVKNDFFWDSRQTVNAREGHFLLWPAAPNLDINDADINDRSNFNFLAIQTRLTGKISGPDAFGAKTSGVIEGDFFAQSNANINLFRLRHAFIKLNWKNTELLTGQYWNPLFVTGCFPGTVSFNTGTPMQSFARNPQIRLTQKFGGFSVVAAMLSQRDYSSRGPNPTDTTFTKTMISNDFLRNSNMPDAHLQLMYSSKNEAGSSLLIGAGAAYKSIVPRLYDSHAGKYIVDEKVSGLTAILFTKLVVKPLTFKLEARYGENNVDLLAPGGFAVTRMIDDNGSISQEYSPIQNGTIWGEVHTNGKKVQLGVFGGYLVSMGIKDPRQDDTYPVYGLGTNLVSLMRVSPRFIYIANKFKVACELEYTAAEFGTSFDSNYKAVGSTSKATNTRVLLSAIYSF